MNKKSSVVFLMGVFTTMLALPILYAFGLPSFDVILTTVFGEGNIWAVVFSLFIILFVTFGLSKLIRNVN